jgi:hypothetical protein
MMHRGDHACLIYATNGELSLAVAEYLADGLDANERCWYAAESSRDLAEVRSALEARGIDVEEAEAHGSLWLITADQLYLGDGSFEPERMLDTIHEAIVRVHSDGLAAFRLAGEMSWALRPRPGTERVIEYEARAEELLRRSDATALCLYHRHRMPPELLDGALVVHPLAGVGTQPRPSAFYRPKAIAELRAPQPENVAWKLKHLQRHSH